MRKGIFTPDVAVASLVLNTRRYRRCRSPQENLYSVLNWVVLVFCEGRQR